MTLPATRPILVGLIGTGIQSSQSPRLHEAEARELELEYRYRLIEVDPQDAAPKKLAEILKRLESEGYAGINVTHPFKQVILPYLDEVSSEALAIGAVNTVLFRGGRRIGHNTDWWGFNENFRRGLPDVGKSSVVQVGAGGAGAAVAHALLHSGIDQLRISDVAPARARNLVSRLCSAFGSGRAAAETDAAAGVLGADGVVNATPVGMVGHEGLPFPAALLRSDLWVAEVVYFPLETELLRNARRLGCRTLDGGGMCVFQAARAFQLFSGIEPDAERMLRHFRDESSQIHAP